MEFRVSAAEPVDELNESELPRASLKALFLHPKSPRPDNKARFIQDHCRRQSSD
jgi:hypothetical protein